LHLLLCAAFNPFCPKRIQEEMKISLQSFGISFLLVLVMLCCLCLGYAVVVRLDEPLRAPVLGLPFLIACTQVHIKYTSNNSHTQFFCSYFCLMCVQLQVAAEREIKRSSKKHQELTQEEIFAIPEIQPTLAKLDAIAADWGRSTKV
jgi:hypothetical protein